MRKAILASLALPAALFGAGPALAAEDAFNSQGLRKAVTLEGVREHQAALQAIATANKDTRASGTSGYAASASYVRGRLSAAGYTVHEQEFMFPYVADESRLERVAPAPAKRWRVLRDFKRFGTSDNGAVAGTVQALAAAPTDATPGCEATDFASFATGRIALIERGGCFFRTKADNAVAAGAVGVLIHDNVEQNLAAFNPGLTAPTSFAKPALFLTKALGAELREQAAAGGLVVDMDSKSVSEQRSTTNLWAETSGDPNRTVVVGAHLDSVVAGPGINDNGSGSGGILEIAEQYASRGLEPRNRIRFMWFGAEERGLLGSRHYVNTLPQEELGKIALNLNFDMIGSPNGARFVYDGDNSAFPVGPGAAAGPQGSGLIEAVFVDYFRNQGLPSAPTPFSGRSDYGPFIAQGIPAGGLFTGAEGDCEAEHAELFGCTLGVDFDPCYHAACDDFANNDDAMLDSMVDGAAHATYTFANTKAAIVNGGILKPGTSTPDGDNDGNGTDGGGGLHPPHDHEHESEDD